MRRYRRCLHNNTNNPIDFCTPCAETFIAYVDELIDEDESVTTAQLIQLAINCENLGQPLGNAVRTELQRRVERK